MMSIRRAYHTPEQAVKKRELWAWAGFDFANSGYTTVVITAIFNAYFVAVVANNAAWATLAWTLALSVSYVLVILGSTWVGMYADANAAKKKLLLWTTVLCALATAALAWIGSDDVVLALLLLIISNTAFGLGENLIAAFLPELASEKGMGRLSGYGWGFGYLGGLLILALCLYWIQSASDRGATTGSAVQDSMLITALLFICAALPTFLLLRERIRPQPQRWSALFIPALRRLLQALVSTRDLPDLSKFLWCIVFFQAGVGTVITVAAIFTQQALGFSTAQSIQLILVVNLTAAIGALLFGFLQDRVGHKAALSLSLCGWLSAIVLLWASDSLVTVWVAANIAGLCLGASQSVGRALVGVMCPPDREAEIFGLWGLAVKLSMILGPVCYGLISLILAGNHRMAMLFTGVFFILGLIQLARVNVVRGIQASRT